jgi:hypothetical protein
MNDENKYTISYIISNISKTIGDFIKYVPTIPYIATKNTPPQPNISLEDYFMSPPTPIIKGFIWLDKTPSIKKNNPTIEFKRGPMGGFCFSDNTPAEFGGCGIPIPEHEELYEKCKKEGIDFYWTTK